MKKNFVMLTVFVFVFLLTNIGYSLTVIPNAPWQQGFGIDTPAGSGRHLGTPSTNIIKVTNLNDSGPGSLRDALIGQNGPKTIIFEVSGTIYLQSDIRVGGTPSVNAETKGSYITIAGQTAPSPGITIARRTFIVERNCHDILIQHLRFRPGDDLTGADSKRSDMQDAFQTYWSYDGVTTFPTSNLVIDHCSFSWGVDENLELGGRNTTIMNSIISEGLNNNQHIKGPHSKGLQTINYGSNVPEAGAQNVAIIKNVFAHNVDRNPFVSGGSAIVANNVFFDVGNGPKANDQANNKLVKISVVGNYIYDTDITSAAMYLVLGSNDASKIYLGTDNYFYGEVKTNPWPPDGLEDTEEREFTGVPTSDIPEYFKASTASDAIWPRGYTAMSAADARDYVLSNAGARPADRDAVDERILKDVRTQSITAELVDTVYYSNSDCIGVDNPVGCCTGPGTGTCVQCDEGGWPNLAQNTRILNIPSNPNEVQTSGYTKLEEWLHGFSRAVEGKNYISPRTLKLQ